MRLTYSRRQRWKKVATACAVAGALLFVAVFGLVLSAPWIVRAAAIDFLASRDFTEVDARVTHLSFHTIELEAVTGKTRNARLDIERVILDFSRGGPLFGDLISVRLREPVIVYELARPPGRDEIENEFPWLFEDPEPVDPPERFSPFHLATRDGRSVFRIPAGDAVRAIDIDLRRNETGRWAVNFEAVGGRDRWHLAGEWQAVTADRNGTGGFFELKEAVIDPIWTSVAGGQEFDDTEPLHLAGRVDWNETAVEWDVAATAPRGNLSLAEGGKNQRLSWREASFEASGIRRFGAQGWGELQAVFSLAETGLGGLVLEQARGEWRGAEGRIEGFGEAWFPGISGPLHLAQWAESNDGDLEGGATVELGPTRLVSPAFFAERLPPDFSGIQTTGTIGARGELRYGPDGLEQDWQIGVGELDVEAPRQGVRVEGVRTTATLAARDGRWESVRPHVLTFSSFQWGEGGTGRGEIEWRLAAPNRVHIDLAIVQWAGGALSTQNIRFVPGAPDFRLELWADGVELAELLALTPEFGGEAEGTIDGRLALRVSRDGVVFEPGFLGLREDATAHLRLPPREWFTGEMSPEEPRYEAMRTVERALEDLELNQFRVEFLDPANETDPPLRVSIEGQPVSPEVAVPSVSLTLNVRGPVREIHSWMLAPQVRVAP